MELKLITLARLCRVSISFRLHNTTGVAVATAAKLRATDTTQTTS